MIPRGYCKSFQMHGLYLTRGRRDAEGLKEDDPLGLCASASLCELIASGRRPGWVHPRFVRNEANWVRLCKRFCMDRWCGLCY